MAWGTRRDATVIRHASTALILSIQVKRNKSICHVASVSCTVNWWSYFPCVAWSLDIFPRGDELQDSVGYLHCLIFHQNDVKSLDVQLSPLLDLKPPPQQTHGLNRILSHCGGSKRGMGHFFPPTKLGKEFINMLQTMDHIVWSFHFLEREQNFNGLNPKFVWKESWARSPSSKDIDIRPHTRHALVSSFVCVCIVYLKHWLV